MRFFYLCLSIKKQTKNQTTVRCAAAFTIGVFLFGCDDGPAPDAIAGAQAFSGTWQTEGTWNLSGPFEEELSVGEIVAESLVKKTVNVAGVPSILEEETEELLSDAIETPVARFVDARTPDALSPGSDLRTMLSGVFATMAVQTEVILTPKDDTSHRLTGTERITSITFPLDDATVTTMLSAVPLVDVSAELTAKGTSESSIFIESHSFNIHFEKLVLWLLENETEIDVAQLTQELDEAVSCDAIVNDVIGDSLSFEVMNQKVEITPSMLASACNMVQQETKVKALGMFQKDTGIDISGKWLLSLPDSTSSTGSQFLSDEDYGGKLTTFSEYLAPAIQVEMSGDRQTP